MTMKATHVRTSPAPRKVSRKAREATILRRAPASRSSALSHVGANQPQLRVGASLEQVRIQQSNASESFHRPAFGPVAALHALQPSSLMRAPQDGAEKSAGGASPDKGTEAKGAENAAREDGGPCIRTPFPPGEVRFSGSAEALKDFAVIPEDASGADDWQHPESGKTYDSDGFWWKHRADAWFKIPSHCTTDVEAGSGTFSPSWCCNWFASQFKGVPRWSTDGHTVTNPFTR
jgi:hypothetical protein